MILTLAPSNERTSTGPYLATYNVRVGLVRDSSWCSSLLFTFTTVGVPKINMEQSIPSLPAPSHQQQLQKLSIEASPKIASSFMEYCTRSFCPQIGRTLFQNGEAFSAILSSVMGYRRVPLHCRACRCKPIEHIPDLSTVLRHSHQIFSLFLELPNISDTIAIAGYLANLFPNVFSLEVIFAYGGSKGKLILSLIRLLWDDHHDRMHSFFNRYRIGRRLLTRCPNFQRQTI